MKAKWITIGLCVVMQTGWAAAPVEEAHDYVTDSETSQPPVEDRGFRIEPADQSVTHADMTGDARLLTLAQQVDQLTQQLQGTQRQVAQLKGQLEEQAQQLKELQARSGVSPKKGYSLGSYFSSAKKQQAAARPMNETDSYQSAFNLLMQKQYAQAKNQFNAYLKQYPQGQYGSNVNYWLGEIALIERDYSGAEHAFLQVIRQYPQSGKYSDAQYKLAITHLQMGKVDQARKEFTMIEREHAGKTVARLAKLQLQQMV